MQVVMVMFRSDGEKRSFSISREVTIIGRREDCDLRIPLTEVSRKHCRLVKDADSLKVEDLGSSNGTFHNGERVREATLTAGDTLSIGPVVFAVQIDGNPPEEMLQPVVAPTALAEPSSPQEETIEVLEPMNDLQVTTDVPEIMPEDLHPDNEVTELMDIEIEETK